MEGQAQDRTLLVAPCCKGAEALLSGGLFPETSERHFCRAWATREHTSAQMHTNHEVEMEGFDQSLTELGVTTAKPTSEKK